jgi:hypothetical protein
MVLIVAANAPMDGPTAGWPRAVANLLAIAAGERELMVP